MGELKRAIQYFVSENGGTEKPKLLVISGGSVGLPGLIPYLTKELELEVVIGNPFARIEIPVEVKKNVVNYAPLYAVAVGLALRGT